MSSNDIVQPASRSPTPATMIKERFGQCTRQSDQVVTDFDTGLVCDGVLTGGSVGSVRVVVEVSLAVNEGSK